MELENRVVLTGLIVAVAGGVTLSALSFVGVLPPWVLELAVFSWPMVAGIVAPQLYLAWRGVPPATSRRGVAAVFLAFAVAIGLQSVVDDRLAVGLAVAIVFVEVCYEGHLGYRDASAGPGTTSTREE